jgi:hypothetical protein
MYFSPPTIFHFPPFLFRRHSFTYDFSFNNSRFRLFVLHQSYECSQGTVEWKIKMGKKAGEDGREGMLQGQKIKE